MRMDSKYSWLWGGGGFYFEPWVWYPREWSAKSDLREPAK